ncbi:MAG TPA: cyanophycin synthetase, partial [Steroidobacteraceae bacterium]|nr:cyanophycin synthetase [Steroidobacteraceae bacterium]
ASEVGAVLFRLGAEFDWQRNGDEWNWRGLGTAFSNLPRPALHGEIQYNNASAVLATIAALGDRLPVEPAAIDRGLRTVSLRGRFEAVPNPRSAARWIVDVAHNPAAAQTLAAQLERAPTTGRTIAVCGILGDKDVEGVVATLKDRVDVWIVCSLASARALPVSDLAARFGSAGVTVAHRADDVASACAIAERIAQPDDRVIVFGSFLTAAAAIEYLGRGNAFC